MIYSSRLKKILHYCLTHRDQYVTLDELADLLKISKRTIFRELKDVDQDLKSYDLHLDNKSGKGIRIIGNEIAKNELLQELQTQGIAYINKEERTHLLKFELLHHSDITKLIHYANLFQVSEATISNDLDVMVPWFETYQLQLVRKPGLGVEVVGKEADVRKAMSDVLHESLQKRKQDSVNYLDSQTLLDQIFMKDEEGSIMHLLNQDILERILQVFHDEHHELNLDRYAQSSYIGLIIHLTIAIERILKNEEIIDNEQVVTMIQQDISFAQAEKMAILLEKEFDIDIPKTEIAFIALHIKGAKINSTSYNDVEDDEYTNISTMIQTMFHEYDETIRLQLVQDEELLHGLCTHLEPTIIRLKNQLPIYNPLVAQIKEMYNDLYEQTRHACHVLEKEYNCSVSEDEVGFITMHIGASLERTKQHRIHKRDVVIGVVCASGIGVSALLSARIQKAFPFGIQLHVLSMEEMLHKQYEDCELLVSTFPVDTEDVHVLCVSPLLTNEDILCIRKEIDELSKKEVVKKFEPSFDFTTSLQQIKQLSEDILEVLQHIQVSELDAYEQQDMLQKIAKDHGEDEHMQKLLYEDILKREQMGSVVMQDYGFVLYHTKSSGIAHCVIHFYYPKGNAFQEMLYKDMNFIMVLLCPMQNDVMKQHVLALISKSLIDNNVFYTVVKSRQLYDIKQVLSDILHAYMIDYLEDHL